jgi:hypothetical protein|nr:MAG TPA: tail assembly chaperone protein [Caudoviricetes sp.]
MTKEGTIQLTTPLKINGEDYTELTHDIGKITIEDLAEIERERNEMLGPKAGTIFRVAQNDNLMHTLLGMHAIIKCNPKIDINDLKRVEGYDLCQMAMVGLRFFSRPAIQESNDSEKPQEDTQDNSTVLSQSSTENPLSN